MNAHSMTDLTKVVLAGLLLIGPVPAESCELASQHAGVSFPVERIEDAWRCRVQPIVEEFTTANKIGPVRTPLAETLYVYLLDRPPTAAALVNRLDLGLYKAEVRGPNRYWGDDGEGTVGLVELIYRDRSYRVYYLEGIHDSPLLPHVTGKAVVFLQMAPVTDAVTGQEAVETTLVTYTRLDNRFVASLVSLLRPLVGRTVARKLTKGVDAVSKLGVEMHRHPERVLFEATDPPPLPPEDVAFLTQVLGKQGGPQLRTNKERTAR